MESNKVKIWLPTIRTRSGTDVFTERLACALRRQGMIAEISWFSPKYEPLPFMLRRKPAPIGTDIILTNSWYGFAFKRERLPLVVTVHHSGFSDASTPYRSTAQKLYHQCIIRPAELRSLCYADVVTTVSHFAAKSLTGIVSKQKIKVIHNWIDTTLFHPLATPLPSSSKFRLLFVGKPSRLKGIDLLPGIMEKLGEGFQLCIAGLANQKEFSHFPANVRWLGWLDEPALIRAYQECDALLFPSRSEGFGYVALEAMACGKPVIASDVTALPELVEHNVTGLLCPPDNEDAFIRACRELANNPQMCVAMGNAARKRAIKEFSEEKMISKYLDLIKKLTPFVPIRP